MTAREKAESILDDVFDWEQCINNRRTFEKDSFTYTRLVDVISNLLEGTETVGVLKQEASDQAELEEAARLLSKTYAPAITRYSPEADEAQEESLEEQVQAFLSRHEAKRGKGQP